MNNSFYFSTIASLSAQLGRLSPLATVIVNIPTENRTVSAEAIGMPQFIMVDAAKKKVWAAMDKDQKQRSEIIVVRHLGGKLILQGADEGIDKQREAVSWTANISEATGKLILTAAGEEAVFAVFGACLPQ